MKLKKYIEELEEEYAFMAASSFQKDWHDIFRNPSTKEIQTVKSINRVRFCINLKNKELFVWNPDLLHYAASDYGEKEGIFDENSYSLMDAVRNPYVWGVAMVEGSKLEILDQEPGEGSEIDFALFQKKRDKHGKDISWLKHWFTNDSFADLMGENL
jgi:hypothetical protein